MKYLRNVAALLRNIDPNDIQDFADSLSNTQYTSKKWLADSLFANREHFPTNPSIMILGSWYGSYLVPMLEPLQPSDIILNDIDRKVLDYARILHGEKIHWSCFDVDLVPQRVAMYGSDILINTSCEHMGDMKSVSTGNPNTLYVLQSCDNNHDPGHINICHSTDELIEKSGITDVKFAGRLDLGHKNRFMVMGFKRL